MQNVIAQHLRASSDAKLALLAEVPKIEQIAKLLCDCVRRGGTIFTCGNGGSACDAMHLAEELVARYRRERPGIRAQHLVDGGTITCWANDYDFDSVFERQVATLARRGDALIAFSTSGNSKNILLALEAAKRLGVQTIAMLGKTGGKAREVAEISLVVNSPLTAHVQEVHITVVHILCELIETSLYPDAK